MRVCPKTDTQNLANPLITNTHILLLLNQLSSLLLLIAYIPFLGHTLRRMIPRHREQHIDLLKGFPARLGTHEIHEEYDAEARYYLPDPDSPAHALDGDTACEDGDEGEEPFAERTGCAADVAVFEGGDLEGCEVEGLERKGKKEAREK